MNYWNKERDCWPVRRLCRHLGIGRSKFYQWRDRYGQVNHHNGKIPRDYWLLPQEREVIIEFYESHRDDGYRRCCYMMMDQDLVAVSPATVYRVLKQAGAMRRWSGKPSKKGKGFQQPDAPHQHWHIDVSYVNISGTFYYLIGILDGFSRFIVHWDIRESMTERDTQIVLQRARELYADESPRIISDNGSQFISRDFKEYVRVMGMTHVRTSPYYPQSNGKLERWHHSAKSECLRKFTPLSLEDAKRLMTEYVRYYNEDRLHSAIGYIAPKDKLEGRAEKIFKARNQKLEKAREERAERNRRRRQAPAG